MEYCCKEFKNEVENNRIAPPEKGSIYEDDDYWHVLWEWHTILRLLYCPFCGSKLKEENK